MTASRWLSGLALVASMLAAGCGSSASTPSPSPADASGDVTAPADASSDAVGDDAAQGADVVQGTPLCGLPFGEGADAASCLVAAQCRPGQICLVAEGCFCVASGRCLDDPCDGGIASKNCAQTLCAPTSPSSIDVDAGAVGCLTSGC